MARNTGSRQIFSTPAETARAAADLIARGAVAARAQRGAFHWALAGGSTPRQVYHLLQAADYTGLMDWPTVQIYFGDERAVPPDDEHSNYRMAWESLLAHVPVHEDQVHRMRGELGAAAGAAAYQAQLESLADAQGEALPRLDLILLGLGPDGHTASLFPGSPALEERQAWVAPVAHHTPPEPLVDRITLTLPVIEAARMVAFLVTGSSKAEALASVFAAATGAEPLPAARVQPTNGEMIWLLDREAAARLAG